MQTPQRQAEVWNVPEQKKKQDPCGWRGKLRSEVREQVRRVGPEAGASDWLLSKCRGAAHKGGCRDLRGYHSQPSSGPGESRLRARKGPGSNLKTQRRFLPLRFPAGGQPSAPARDPHLCVQAMVGVCGSGSRVCKSCWPQAVVQQVPQGGLCRLGLWSSPCSLTGPLCVIGSHTEREPGTT